MGTVVSGRQTACFYESIMIIGYEVDAFRFSDFGKPLSAFLCILVRAVGTECAVEHYGADGLDGAVV